MPLFLSITALQKPLNLLQILTYLEKVLINLIKNAFQALEKSTGGKVHVSAYRRMRKQVCVILVKDNGSGIPTNILDDIFIPFYTTKNNGSGIGLSLSRQIIEIT